MQGTKLAKYFGHDLGIWWCRFGTCLVIMNVSELKALDEQSKISWSRPSKQSNLIMPICDKHGALLNYAAEKDKIVRDGVRLDGVKLH